MERVRFMSALVQHGRIFDIYEAGVNGQHVEPRYPLFKLKGGEAFRSGLLLSMGKMTLSCRLRRAGSSLNRRDIM